MYTFIYLHVCLCVHYIVHIQLCFSSLRCTCSYDGFHRQEALSRAHYSALELQQVQAVSGEVREVLKGYDPTFCPVGLDEAYLDITDRARRMLLKEQAGDGAAVFGRHQLWVNDRV